MTDPFLDLHICIINFICGLFFFITYYGVLLFEKNKKRYLIYFLDIISIIILGSVYLMVVDSNKINFHLYNLFFITIGYLSGMLLFKNSLKEDYSIFFVIVKYLISKIIVVIKWCFDIIPLNLLRSKIKLIIFKFKIKRHIKKAKQKEDSLSK